MLASSVRLVQERGPAQSTISTSEAVEVAVSESQTLSREQMMRQYCVSHEMVFSCVTSTYECVALEPGIGDSVGAMVGTGAAVGTGATVGPRVGS